MTTITPSSLDRKSYGSGRSTAGRTLSAGCFLDLTVADAGSADTDTLAGTLDESMNSLQIEIPTTLGDIVSMAHAMPKLRSPTAHFTNFCHR